MNSSTPRWFLDRSIGTKKIAAAMRAMGLDVETIKDRYGESANTVVDVRWIEDASREGRILLCADKRIRYNPLERRALCIHRARCFTFPRGDLTAAEMIAQISENLPAMMRLVMRPGPYVYHLGNAGLDRVKLDCEDFG